MSIIKLKPKQIKLMFFIIMLISGNIFAQILNNLDRSRAMWVLSAKIDKFRKQLNFFHYLTFFQIFALV